MPPALQKLMTSREVKKMKSTFCVWTEDGTTWHCNPMDGEDASKDLLPTIDGNPQTYVEYGKWFYPADLPLEAVRQLADGVPVTKELVAALNPKRNEWEEIKAGLDKIGYFDEGVFGNYGWDEPLGACGLIAWTSEGTPLWKNENYSIYDCYAISLDEEENLWFYYYDEFRLVRTNFKEDFVFELPIEGSGAFSVAPSGNTFLFQGGYQQRDKFYFLTAHGDHLGKKQEATNHIYAPHLHLRRLPDLLAVQHL